MATVSQAQTQRAAKTKKAVLPGSKLTLGKQLFYQFLCLVIAFTVLFPIAWVFSVSINSLNESRPTSFIPANPTLDAYGQVLQKPTQNDISFWGLAFNSFKLAFGTSFFAVLVGVSAAYAFSRFQFPARKFLFLSILAVLMLPGFATIAPLYTLLNHVKIGDFILRDSLWGVGIAILSGSLPFSIYNMKGYLDAAVPKDLEEASFIDGATRNQTFLRIVLPLTTPVLAVTALFGFIGGWTEFALSWQFLDNVNDYTLAMALDSMQGQFARTTPWSEFSAFAILMALPVTVVYLFLQRYIVSGLTLGGVKG